MTHKLLDLIGKNLGNFIVTEMYEIYMVNEDGKPSKSLGLMKQKHVAEAFRANQTDEAWYKVDAVMVLTDGTVAFAFDQKRPVTILNEEAEEIALKKAALAKLSPADRKLLGHE